MSDLNVGNYLRWQKYLYLDTNPSTMWSICYRLTGLVHEECLNANYYKLKLISNG